MLETLVGSAGMGWRGRRELIDVQLTCRLAAYPVDLISRDSYVQCCLAIFTEQSRSVLVLVLARACALLSWPRRVCVVTFTPVVGRAADRLQGSARC